MLKNEKGVTLLILVVMVVVLGILLYAGINVGTTSIAEVNLQNFSYEMQQIQGRVDSIHEKMSMENEPTYATLGGSVLGQNITASNDAVKLLQKTNGMDYSDITNGTDPSYYLESDPSISTYRYFSKKDLGNDLNIKNAKLNVIINFESRQVMCVEGFNYYGTIYHTLSDIKENK